MLVCPDYLRRTIENAPDRNLCPYLEGQFTKFSEISPFVFSANLMGRIFP